MSTDKDKHTLRRKGGAHGPTPYSYPLFEHLLVEHKLILTESELTDIIEVVRKLDATLCASAALRETPPENFPKEQSPNQCADAPDIQ